VNVEHDQLFPKCYRGAFQTSTTISSLMQTRKLRTSKTVCSKVSIDTPGTPFEGTLVRREGPGQFFRSSSENVHTAIRSACMGSDELLINLYTLELDDESRT